MIYNKVNVKFEGVRKITGPTIFYKYDAVQILVIEGLELPDYYEVDFCNEGDQSTITMVGTDDGVQIPDNFFQTGKRIKAYIVLHGEDEGAVETRYEITLPVNKRPLRSDIEPTPAEQQQIDSIIAELNLSADHIREAEVIAQNSEAQALKAEGYSVGEQNGEEVEPDSPYFENNAKFYAEVAGQAAGDAGWVHFYIDDQGRLHYVKTENCDLDFYIDNNGYLHVTNGEA